MKKRIIVISAAALAIATPAAVIGAKHLDTSSTAPVLKSSAENWSKTANVSVATSATFGGSDLDHYEYCISSTDNIDDCEWKISSVETVRVRNLGTSYVWMRAVSKYGVISDISDYVLTRVDRNKPEASATDEISTNSITVAVTAADDFGVKSYEYAINDSDYVTDGANHTFDGLTSGTTYNIKVRITDLAGNTKYLSYQQSTSSPATTRSARPSGNISFTNAPKERFSGGGKPSNSSSRSGKGEKPANNTIAKSDITEETVEPEESNLPPEAELPDEPEEENPDEQEWTDCTEEPEQPQDPEESEDIEELENTEEPSIAPCHEQPEELENTDESEENQPTETDEPSENDESASTDELENTNELNNNDESDAIENSEENGQQDTIFDKAEPSESTSAIEF